jgi:hypothetical protein
VRGYLYRKLPFLREGILVVEAATLFYLQNLLKLYEYLFKFCIFPAIPIGSPL